jgi:hypothetical protein
VPAPADLAALGRVLRSLSEPAGLSQEALGALRPLYHVGYGMGGEEILSLFGLGVVYAIAYGLTQNLLVLWPLLTPLGYFFAQLEEGDLAGQASMSLSSGVRGRPCTHGAYAMVSPAVSLGGPAPGPVPDGKELAHFACAFTSEVEALNEPCEGRWR